jgi:hypothetical protein
MEFFPMDVTSLDQAKNWFPSMLVFSGYTWRCSGLGLSVHDCK